MVACAKAEPPANPNDNRPALQPKAPEIRVELAGVTLADDRAEVVSEVRGECGSPGGCPLPAQPMFVVRA